MAKQKWQGGDRPRVVIIYPPFGLVESPSLGTSVVKAATVEAGFECDVLYASVEFAARIDFENYLPLSHSQSQALLPERIFATALMPDLPPFDVYYKHNIETFNAPFSEFIASQHQGSSGKVEQFMGIEAEAIAFCDELAARPEMERYDIFAFSNSTGQNLATLAMGKRLKKRFPERIVAVGGANVDGPMGPQMVRSFDFVDFALAGDGDVGFPMLLDTLVRGEAVDIPGVFWTGNCEVGVAEKQPPPVRMNLDDLPYPDFDDWFAVYDRHPQYHAFQMSLPVEGSRGCWWGAKHHCTFCGLNGMTLTYRSKSPQRLVDEIDDLVNRHGIKSVMTLDNIMDARWPRTLVPLLREKRSYDVLFFETKGSISREELVDLAEVGITHMVPGIESLSTHVLELMSKGTKCQQNIQILKWAEEIGSSLQWCFLSGFPGETAQDYDEMAALIPKIMHLKPAKTFTRISIDRFSPYFEHPEKYGMKLDVCPSYRYVFDLPDDEIRNLAYWYYSEHENGSSRDSLEPPEYGRGVTRAHRIWQAMYERVHFRYTIDDRGLVHLDDTRPIADEQHRCLDELQSALFRLCDATIRRHTLLRRLRSDPRFAGVEDEAVDRALADLVERAVVHCDAPDRYLALACLDTGVEKFPVMAEVKLSPRTD